MTTCGICVCPTPLPTLPAGDLCNVFNETHVICAYGRVANNMSWGNAFLDGVIITLVVIGLIWMIRYLTTPENGKENTK